MGIDVPDEKWPQKEKVPFSRKLLQCKSLTAVASFAPLKSQERLKLGYNFVALGLLQYKYDSKSGRMVCSECNYAFHLNASYNYEQHSLHGKHCTMAVKGGYTLNPKDNYANTANEQAFANALRSEDKAFDDQMEVSEGKMLEGDSVLEENETLALANPKSSATFAELTLNNLYSEEDIIFYSFKERLKSLEVFGWLKTRVKRVLSYLGFFSPKSDEKCLKCIFCKLKMPFDSIRSLFRKHKTFSPNCCFAGEDWLSFGATDDPDEITKEEKFVAKMLKGNLSTFTSKCPLSDAKCIEAALAGYQYLPYSNSLKCFGCDSLFPVRHVKRYSNFLETRIAAICTCGFNKLFKMMHSEGENLDLAQSSQIQIFNNSVNDEKSLFWRYFGDLVPERLVLRARQAVDSRLENDAVLNSSPAYLSPKHERSSRKMAVERSDKLSENSKALSDSMGSQHDKSSLAQPDHGDTCEDIETRPVLSREPETHRGEIGGSFVHKSSTDSLMSRYSKLNSDLSDVIAVKNTPFQSFFRDIWAQLTEPERVATSKLRTREEVSRCSVCLCNESNRLFVGCGHICTCEDCVLLVPSCPICRARITGVLPIELPARNSGVNSNSL